jgi:hypothetical protein
VTINATSICGCCDLLSLEKPFFQLILLESFKIKIRYIIKKQIIIKGVKHFGKTDNIIFC